MTNQNFTENQPNNSDNSRSSSPGDRLRKMLAASEGEGSSVESDQNISKPEPPTEEPNNYPSPPPILRGNSLPLHVSETDPQATQVTPSAYRHASQQKRVQNLPPMTRDASIGTRRNYPPSQTQHTTNLIADRGHSSDKKPPAQKNKSCLFNVIILFLFASIGILVIIVSIAVFQYFSIVASLPDIDNLAQRASQFETTRILDKNGGLLYEMIDPNAGRRTYVKLKDMSPYLIAATIATEDEEYYNHPGYNPLAIARAFWQNYTTGETVSGASTITQQLARAILFSPEEREDRSYYRKTREAVLAAEITRKYSKEEILELYLNEIYYGYMAYGIEAAAETYFNTTSSNLTLSQAAFLAGLPQAPSVYDIRQNREATLERYKQVLGLMYEVSTTKGCIFVSTNIQPVCIDAVVATQALYEIQDYPFNIRENPMKYPHWVTYVRSILEKEFDPQTIYKSGFNVYTTLDPNIQDIAENVLRMQVTNLAEKNVTGGAVVILKPATGEILAMVGSPDFYNESASGQVNMAVSPRQPGSSIKPLTYVAAFEKGWTPATLIWDVPSEFPPSGDPSDTRPPYVPINYDEKFHGPVKVRNALANSYNIPAVKTLQFVGIYDNLTTPEKDGLISFAKRLGITTLTRADYGLALTLGGGDVSPLELTTAFAVYANGGKKVTPVSIDHIVDYQGNTIFTNNHISSDQIVREEHAFLISSILSDNGARTPMFGADSVLNLPFPAAVKTGTTNDFRDNWTLGYTPDIAIGVWVGNPDYTPMERTTGLTGAAPIWAELMKNISPMISGSASPNFTRPAGVVEKVICSISGTEPSEWCPQQQSEFFAVDQPPASNSNDLWRKVKVDTWTGYLSSQACSEFSKEEITLNISDKWAQNWINDTPEGKEWANGLGFTQPFTFTPQRECKIDDPRPTLFFAGINDGQVITNNILDIYVIANASQNFKQFSLQYGLGNDPVDWYTLVQNIPNQYTQPERIFSWDLSDVKSEQIALKLFMESNADTYAERRIRLSIKLPTVTPSLTPTASSTPTTTLIPTQTKTEALTSTPTSTLNPSTPTPSTTATP